MGGLDFDGSATVCAGRVVLPPGRVMLRWIADGSARSCSCSAS